MPSMLATVILSETLTILITWLSPMTSLPWQEWSSGPPRRGQAYAKAIALTYTHKEAPIECFLKNVLRVKYRFKRRCLVFFSSATEEAGLLGALKVVFKTIFLNIFEKIYTKQSMVQLYKWKRLQIFEAVNANNPI